jgi:hypothetical protein
MKGLWIALAVAALPLCRAQNGTGLAPIALYTEFAAEPPMAVLEALQSEVQSIMAPMGLRFQWRELADADGKHVSVELAVINFKGRCDLAGLLPHDGNPGPLGWTHISNGVILPFANVDCSAVRSFMQRELLNTRPEIRAATFGRALGRVLAHELYHIFANTTRHGAGGVAREFYSIRDLLSPDFQFQAKESQALLNSKVHAALVATPSLLADDAEHRN